MKETTTDVATRLSFICTGHGRGGHSPESLTPVDGGPKRAVELHCPQCSRQRRLGYKALQRAIGAGLTTLDISLLPD